MKFEDIVQLIEQHTGLPREEIIKQIDVKYKELSGLITEEGAAYIVARNLGIELPTAVRGLQIKNVLPGMRNINIIGRIFRISPITSFTRSNGEEGRVANIYIADETGYVKVPLWNDQVSIVSEGMVKVGDVVQLVNGLARESIFGDLEISLGKYGSIRTLEGEFNLPSAEELEKTYFGNATRRIAIADIVPGRWEIRGIILQVFKGKYLFNVCPACGATILDACPEHGKIQPVKEMVFTVIVDDGTADIRTVFFRKLAERLLGITAEELSTASDEEKFDLARKQLGRELVLVGRAKKNVRFDRMEFIVEDFEDLDAVKESKMLLKSLRW